MTFVQISHSKTNTEIIRGYKDGYLDTHILGRMSVFIHTCVSVMTDTKSDLDHNNSVHGLKETVEDLLVVKIFGTMVAVDHNNSEDGKGNLSPLFTSKHNVSIVGAPLKPWSWGR